MTGDGFPGFGFSGAIERTNKKNPIKNFADSYARLTTRALAAWCSECNGNGWTAYGDDVTRCLRCDHQADT